MTAHPFDAAAESYDTTFTEPQLGTWLRTMVRDQLPFRAGDHILELGCGTGEDATWMTQNGIQVTATDASTEMLAITQEKVTGADLANITAQPLDLNNPHPLSEMFDGVLANFGVLNCVHNRRSLAEYLSEHVRQNARLALVVMGPICPWEILIHISKGDFKGATRRFHKSVDARIGDGQIITVDYPSPHALIAEFAPYFAPQRTVAIGTFLPPSYMSHFVDRWPRIFARFAQLDRLTGGYFPFTWLNDHYYIEFARP